MGCGCEKEKGNILKPKRFNLPISKQETNKKTEKLTYVDQTQQKKSKKGNSNNLAIKKTIINLNEKKHIKETSNNIKHSLHHKNYSNRIREQKLREKQ
jgi:hypothetical protein